ncbi:MAG: hypothetical protein ACYS5V_10820 [Planctomycetota bacterium]
MPRRDARGLTVYQRIMRAARNGWGLRLTWEDVAELARDPAIDTTAERDDGEGEPD